MSALPERSDAPPPSYQVVAPYHPPPTYPPPRPERAGRTETRATFSVVAAIVGIFLGLLTGVGGLVLGPVAYFLGKSARNRIDSSEGKLGGRGTAGAGWVMGVVATAIGALVTLAWFIIILFVASSGPA